MSAKGMTADSARETARRARSVVSGLLAELEAIVSNGRALEALGDVMADPDGQAGQAEAVIQESYRQAISLPSRIDAMHKLGETMKTLGMLDGAPDMASTKRAALMWKLAKGRVSRKSRKGAA